jgi:glycerol kinase
MQADSGVDLNTLKVDGGMVVNELLMQFQADILGLPVIRPTVNETTALGAAYAAGLAVGFWNGEDELRANWGIEKTWHPEMEKAVGDHLFSQWKKAVERSLGWIE